MYSSPVRRFTNVLLRLLARLACIRRAASVHSEPGSNSHKGVLRIWTKGHHFNTLTPLLNILYSVVKEQRNSSREPCTILCAQKRVKGFFYQILVGYSLKPHALTATLARSYRGKKHKHLANKAKYIKLFPESQARFAYIPKNCKIHQGLYPQVLQRYLPPP